MTTTEPPPVEAVAEAVVPAGPAKKRSRAGVSAVRWTDTEEAQLRDLVGELSGGASHTLTMKQWEVAATRLGSNRTAGSLQQHWCATNFFSARASAARERTLVWVGAMLAARPPI